MAPQTAHLTTRACTSEHVNGVTTAWGSWRGAKRDAWEAGHRVPFVASWPASIPQGSRCDQLIGLGDLMATCAEMTGIELPEGAGEDSVSILPLLRGDTDTPVREFAIHHSGSGKFAVRKGDWVFIDAPSGDDGDREPDWFKAERGYTPPRSPRRALQRWR